MKVGFYDTETLRDPSKTGWDNYRRMGMSVGCVVAVEGDFKEDRMNGKVFKPKVERKSFTKATAMVKYMNGLDLVVGFNSEGFDDNLLCALAGKDQEFLFHTFDVMKDLENITGIKYITGLDSLATETVNASKPEDVDGSMAFILWEQGEYKKVTDYCFNDCDILAEVFIFGVLNGYVLVKPNKGDIFGNMVIKVPVNWNEIITNN